MHKEAVYHEAHGKYAYPVGPETLRLILKAQRGDLVKVVVVYQDRYNNSDEYIQEMEKITSDQLFDYFQVDVSLSTQRFLYKFLLDDGVHKTYYTEKGFYADPPMLSEFHFPYIAAGDQFAPPLWSQGAVWYQIFPERFANGDPANDPENVEDWETPPTRESQKGGDLQGIIDHLDYIADLGVDAIYLNPLFKAPTNHKYDTTDYYSIDEHFGDLKTCQQLVELCHKKGIKVVFDAVFNHCGYDFFAFQDVVRKGVDSPYAHWFNIESFPVRKIPPNYETFANEEWRMPKLMTNVPEVRKYLLDVACYWMRECNIDGWRLDVCNEVDHDFWREFRKVVKKENPEAIILGEIWHEASNWVQGDQFDSVMNYSFTYACADFFAKGAIRAETFAHRLAQVQMNHRQVVNLAMFNLLDCHDTERFLTTCSNNKEKMRLAVAFQLTYEGAPSIYYGDEVGMYGKNDPDCRKGMIWDEDKQDREMLAWYKKLIAIRKLYQPLRTGACRTVYADSATNVFGFVRFSDSEQLLVMVNNSPYHRKVTLSADQWPLALPKQVKDLVTEETFDGSGDLSIPPYNVRILK